MSTQEIANQFAAAVQAAEKKRSPEPLMPYFDDESTLINLGLQQPVKGKRAGQFWTSYLNQFRSVRSDFSHRNAYDDNAVLEWTSSGELTDGTSIDYRGVSLLKIEGQTVRDFRTYYDSAAFVETASRS
ncbi:nuclear transport factor 2 family protein [Crateriforma conspicua]|uniref:SnoaL-like domain-containing protein n=1 Tax=Crateriforma conspicua TaxID=2527996 RepID=A0A5C6FL50_9PLAN|nr:nuclear transport factor 2 family protein [Crateriforma conspicua]TWU62179.1 hypothetical protein V7x_39080 [Crateriforma conspicua]